MMYGFHSGMWGSASRVCCMKGCHIWTASPCSRFEPRSGTSGGRMDSQGAEVHRKSDADRVLPGIRPGANIAKDSSR
jgi:hypothetical protein